MKLSDFHLFLLVLKMGFLTILRKRIPLEWKHQQKGETL